MLLIILTSTAVLQAFESGAYIPSYRLNFLPGAENTLGRPSIDPTPGAWSGRIKNPENLPERWYEENWSLRLARGFNSFYLQIPFGTEPDFRWISYLNSIVTTTPTRVYISLIGQSSDFLNSERATDDMVIIINQLVELSRRYHLDGVDIDWEFPGVPRQAEKKALTKLAAGLQVGLPDETRLSVAVSRWRLPDANLFEAVDEVHLMAYDGYGKHSTYDSAVADSEIILTRFNLPPEKLILGLPYYGRIYNPASDEYWKGTKNYADIVQDYSPGNTEDVAADYYFNSPSTIEKKTEWAIQRGLRGIFVWEPFYDAEGDQSLTESIHRVILRN